jgi:hypothetical protein
MLPICESLTRSTQIIQIVVDKQTNVMGIRKEGQELIFLRYTF